ncbi:MAG TPA: DUF6114 domain-containing protein [Streptosporangiaceae bacterium]|nr:DUF6114 domain-containing protein [Streptosporangiaceae bacterium]
MTRGPRRSAFRQWRRSRPFWGGLLLLLGGLEMLLIPLTGVLARGQIKLVIYVGIGGVFGILLGALLIACGLALWFTPVHKTFYAIAGLLLSLLSFIGTNLGGFFIGMLLGIVGGSLAFAWTPGLVTETDAEPAPPSRHDERSSAGLELVAGDPDPGDETDPGDDADPGEPLRADWGLNEPRHGRRRRTGWAGRTLAVAALLAVASAAVLTGGGRASAAEVHPARAQSGQGCILFVICSPSPSASPAPSPSRNSGTGGGGGGSLPIPTVLPSSGSGLPSAVTGLGGTATNPAGGAAGGAGKAKGPNNKKAQGTQGLVVASEPSVITANSATLDGLAYQGAVAMPVSGGGTVTMMKFTMTSQQLSHLDLTVAGAGGSLVTAATSASFSGDVVLYATKLTGQLAGVPLTLTPGNAESTLLQLLKSLTPLVPVTLTNVTASQPVVLGNAGAISALSVRAS